MSSAFWLSLLLVFFASLLSLLFSSLTYSLRDFSRPRLTDVLAQLNRSQWLQQTIERAPDLIFATAIGRLFANLLVFIGVLHTTRVVIGPGYEWTRYLIAGAITSVITTFVSVAIPHAVAEHVGEPLIAHSVRFLMLLRIFVQPMMRVLNGVDHLVRNLAGRREDEKAEQLAEEIEQEILSAVEEGEKEGVVDEHEREMIESVMEFADATVKEIMTPRQKIIGVPGSGKLDQVKSLFQESGHSRLPVYEETIDKIIGMLYARDLIALLGEPADAFNLRLVMRAPFHVPETKPLRDLVDDFRAHKVHIAVVLDEYGGTAGLITIEDILRDLLGGVGDEHAPAEPSLIRRIDEHTAEVDAVILIEQLNRVMNLQIPEDAGYETLGGFVSTTLGRVPEAGARFENDGVRYTILDVEPQKVNRVRVEVLNRSPQPSDSSA